MKVMIIIIIMVVVMVIIMAILIRIIVAVVAIAVVVAVIVIIIVYTSLLKPTQNPISHSFHFSLGLYHLTTVSFLTIQESSANNLITPNF